MTMTRTPPAPTMKNKIHDSGTRGRSCSVNLMRPLNRLCLSTPETHRWILPWRLHGAGVQCLKPDVLALAFRYLDPIQGLITLWHLVSAPFGNKLVRPPGTSSWGALWPFPAWTAMCGQALKVRYLRGDSSIDILLFIHSHIHPLCACVSLSLFCHVSARRRKEGRKEG